MFHILLWLIVFNNAGWMKIIFIICTLFKISYLLKFTFERNFVPCLGQQWVSVIYIWFCHRLVTASQDMFHIVTLYVGHEINFKVSSLDQMSCSLNWFWRRQETIIQDLFHILVLDLDRKATLKAPAWVIVSSDAEH